MLDRMLFRAADPPERYRILERFYRLSPSLIGRFYAGRSTLRDKVRILSGRPPVPLGRAVKALGGAHMKSAIVIGAGFGGLALAIRLQSAGVATTIVEARDKPGGRAYFWESDGHSSTPGRPSSPIPTASRNCGRCRAQDIATDVDLVPVTPFYRLDWPDGVRFDYSNDDAALEAADRRAQSRRRRGLSQLPRILRRRLARRLCQARRQGVPRFGDMLKAAPALVKYQAWRSVYSIVSNFVKSNICDRHSVSIRCSSAAIR